MTLLVKRKSAIQGFGIFATEPIRKGSLFYRIPLAHVFLKPKKHCAFIGNSQWVCDLKVLNFVNHSCMPNALLNLSGKIPVLKALKQIKKGDEITCDYEVTEKGRHKLACSCNSENCRGFFRIRK